jgi:hypothetical protein
MSVSYTLTLAAELTVTELVQLGIAGGIDPGALLISDSGLVHADLSDTRGLGLTIRSGRNGYVDAVDDSGQRWEWEAAVYAAMGFWPDAVGTIDAVPNLVPIVARVLAVRGEDAALVFDGETLLLTRMAGRQVKHNRPLFWDAYPGVDTLLPD